jgi:NAD+ kinase
MKIAIYGRNNPDNTSEHIQLLFQKLADSKAEIIIYKPFYQYLQKSLAIVGHIKTFTEHSELLSGVDYMLSLGGDGTFLETITFVRNSGIPILGINTGRLGFLANVAKTEISTAIDALQNKQFNIEKRSMLCVVSPQAFFGEVNYALNELTLMKKDSFAMITVHAFVNGVFLNSYFGDGLIISTPTGSTAYSLSCGGPLVMSNAQNFIITPIAPHNLNVRPIVIPDEYELRLQVESRSKKYLAALDSRYSEIDSSVEMHIKKSDFGINLIQLENQNFFNTIRNKLLWGIDKRN